MQHSQLAHLTLHLRVYFRYTTCGIATPTTGCEVTAGSIERLSLAEEVVLNGGEHLCMLRSISRAR